MIVNHVFIGRGPAKASDLFNILTWAAIGATVNVYVANPDKRPDERQHDYGSLFNVNHDLANGAKLIYNTEFFFARYKIVGNQAHGIADRVKLISLPDALARHAQIVHADLQVPTAGWKKGILGFLDTMGTWWPKGTSNDGITTRIFSAVDATKFYLSATRQGLTCDMKVAPSKYFRVCEEVMAEKFVSFQRGNQGSSGFENQLSGSMCALPGEPRKAYASKGQELGNGFGSGSVDDNALAYRRITAKHGWAMDQLKLKAQGVDTRTLHKSTVLDPEQGWTGPVRVFKHSTDQSWKGLSVGGSDKSKAKDIIDGMADEVLNMMRGERDLFDKIGFDKELFDMMVALRNFPSFNIYA